MLEFPYHRSVSPLLGVLLGLAIVETIVLHIVVVALWGWTVALIAGVLDLSLILALIGLLRAIRRYPVSIADGRLVMRVGKLRVIPIPLVQVAGFRSSWDAAALKQKGVANLALAAWPNIVIDLSPPVRAGRREVNAVAHRLDEPAVFRDAVTSLASSSA